MDDQLVDVDKKKEPKLWYAMGDFTLCSEHEISVTKKCECESEDKIKHSWEVKIHSTWTVKDDYNWHPEEPAGGVYDDWAKWLQNCGKAEEFNVTSKWTEDETEEYEFVEDCNDQDGCYSYGNGCEDRNYFCSDGSCTYTYSNRHTDYYGGWVYYCKGDQRWKHRLFHDFSCKRGTCTERTRWEDKQFVVDCDDFDYYTDWTYYCVGDEVWMGREFYDFSCVGGECVLVDIIPKDYEFVEDCNDRDGCYSYGNGCEDRDYYCSGGSCNNYTYSNRHTDYYDDWIYYCKGDKVWKHRLFHDFSCKRGTCTERTHWEDKQFVVDCDDFDYYTDWTYYCYMRVREFYDYSCDGGECVLVDIIPEDESCGIVVVDEYYLEEEYNLPPPDVPDNCEVTGVDIVVIPVNKVEKYCDDPVWVDCVIVTYCYSYEIGILEASGDLRCYCNFTGEWEDRGPYTWYGDYYIDELWVSSTYPDCPWDSQTLSDTPDEEPLSIMSTDNT